MNQVKDVADRIKQRRLELGLTYRDLEEATGITASTLQRYESGFISKLPIDKLYTIAKGLRVDPGYLMGWTDNEKPKLKTPTSNVGEIVKTRRLPMYGKASAGNGYINLTDEVGYYDVPVQYCTNPDVYTVKISGESMTGLDKAIHDGSVAVVDPQLCSTPEALDGKVCIFTYNDETYIKQLAIDKQGIIRLRSFNPNYDDIIVLKPELLKCEGRVIVTFTESNW
ncbi:MAG: helix-turn-helix domain-containing protein [Sebaldella sp.]|nr:helix-turn-helix domain-containing protein [Sebaldella sp.]